MKRIYIIFLLVCIFMTVGCQATNTDDTDPVQNIISLIPENSVSPTVIAVPTGDSVVSVAPEITETESVSPMPTAEEEPTDKDLEALPTPTQTPDEGYVIGKDVNNNELKMTQEEADQFVFAGNILKLYDGSWFDMDDDGEPEYVSIQPYGRWLDDRDREKGYYVNENGISERIRLSFWTDQLYHICFSGYDWIPLEVEFSQERDGIPNENDVFVCVTSLDGKTKQIITYATLTLGGDNWTESSYYVFRTENKELISCGWFGCDIKEFKLNNDHKYNGYEIIADSSVGNLVPILGEYWFDGTGIRRLFTDIDYDSIDNTLVVSSDTIRVKTLNDTDDYFTVLKGEEIILYKVEIVGNSLEEYCYNRYSTDYDDSLRRFEGFTQLHLQDPDNYSEFKFYLERMATGEKGWIIEKNGIPYSADEADEYFGCFGYCGVN